MGRHGADMMPQTRHRERGKPCPKSSSPTITSCRWVVLSASWPNGPPGSDRTRVVTLAYRAAATFDEFRQLDVQATIPRRLATQVERMLPMLPSIAARTTVSGGDVALVSSSGWAHRFRFEIPHVVYVHSPARWLHAADDYRMRLSPIRRAGLAVSTPLLRRGDHDAIERAHAIVSNSEVTRDRMRAVYGLDSMVVHPPVEPVATEAATARPRAARRVRRRRRPESRLQERDARRRRGAGGADAHRHRRFRFRPARRAR